MSRASRDIRDAHSQKKKEKKNAEWISVEVSARLPGLVEELKTLLTGRPDLPRLDVTAAELPPGGCVVHTPEGMVDASVDTQLGNLAALFQQPR